MKAVILLSGGLDSATVLALAKSQGFVCYALSFDYGQKHSAELTAAKEIATDLNAKKHLIVPLHLQTLGSALTDSNIKIPDFTNDNNKDDNIPATYVPARNTIFLAIALGWAEVLKANDIFIGASSVDYSGYPDCRPEYIAAFQDLANLATKAGVTGNKIRIQAPLINLSKAETIKLGLSLGVPYEKTISCYRADANGKPCGTCDSCMLRAKGFAEVTSR